jgi:sugar lactone lactonase YvrE
MLTGGKCIEPDTTEKKFEKCFVRCWGWNRRGKMEVIPDSKFGQRVTAPKGDPKTATNPQGRVLVLGGNGQAGLRDGPLNQAQFNSPSGLTIWPKKKILFVADTMNNVIRKVFLPGCTEGQSDAVETYAGDPAGVRGITDGHRLNKARFARPEGITLYERKDGTLVLVVADTDNQRIRVIVGDYVDTLSGQKNMPPQQGYRDGSPVVSRFNFPRRVLADRTDGTVYVTDTYNHLIRVVNESGFTRTLAGNLEDVTTDEPGCPPPCKQGVAGFNDGSLTEAQFAYPTGMAWGKNGSLLLTDAHRIRRIVFREGISIIETIKSRNRVSTVSGKVISGKADGMAHETSFNEPRGVAMAQDGRIYVADFVGSRVRRITRGADVAMPISCSATGETVLRPSGCASYDPPSDALDLKGTPIGGNIFYNYKQTLSFNDVISADAAVEYDSDRSIGQAMGKRIMNCNGIPPYDDGVTSNGKTLGPKQGTGNEPFTLKEDTGDKTSIKVRCPPGCATTDSLVGPIYGNMTYVDQSVICKAAIHAGAITRAEGGMFQLIVERGLKEYPGTTQNDVVSTEWTSPRGRKDWYRSFSFDAWFDSFVQTETVAGVPTAFQTNNRGKTDDIQPPQEAKFNGLVDVAVEDDTSLTNGTFLYILDQNNHRIMVMTAVCSKLCENGGVCVKPEVCQCAAGWDGQDCTVPVCSSACPDRSVCVAPDVCGCIPGWQNPDETRLFIKQPNAGASSPYYVALITDNNTMVVPSARLATSIPNNDVCNKPMCVQECIHGACTMPDTCTCDSGWFDPNCTSPVCSQTCGNGGNCTSPNVCTCPSDFRGNTCRVPVCDQTCHNGGNCTAPNTCTCPPEWSGFDCSWPVCNQGRFVRNGLGPGGVGAAKFLRGSNTYQTWKQYVPCQYDEWCKETNGFDCLQEERNTTLLMVDAGPVFRNKTGLKEYPGRCFLMELLPDVIVPFQKEDNYGGMQPHWRYPPVRTYEWDGNNEWSSPGNTGIDRQLVLVEYREIVQGTYVCANSGNCTVPDTCACNNYDWGGFDCRIPMCHQGYLEPDFHKVNPSVAMAPLVHPDGTALWKDKYPGQDTYQCSIRAYTPWENPNYLHRHPNYFSRYMSITKGEDDYIRYATDRHVFLWPPDSLYGRSYNISEAIFDDTRKGWLRMGTWERVGNESVWQKGTCTIEYDRQCGIPEIQYVTVSLNGGIDLSDTTAKKFYNNVGGSFALEFDGSSISVLVADDALTLRLKLESALSVGTIYVTRDDFKILQSDFAKGTFCDYRDPTQPCEDTQCTKRKVKCYPPEILQGCDRNTDCYGQRWRVTFYNNRGDVPKMRVSTGGPLRSQDYACDGEAETIDMGRPCSLTGGYQDGYPPRYQYGAATVMVTTKQEGVASAQKARDVRTLQTGRSVLDTDMVFRPRVSHTNQFTSAVGRWTEEGGKCVDMVVRGCLNNGTCVAPGRCQCAPGWEGNKCDIPVCEQTCLNGGNCTLPNLCTCEKGWSGHDCGYALCAQECNNNGKCVEPDICKCPKWPSLWVDGRIGGGRPLFRDENGNPQNTGWTGFDCSTPVCTQAEAWTPLTLAGGVRLGGDGYVIYGDDPNNNLMGQMPAYLQEQRANDRLKVGPFLRPYEVVPEQLDELSWYRRWVPADGQIVRNDGKSFQSGCTIISPIPAKYLTPQMRRQYPRVDAFRNPLGPGSGIGHQYRVGHYVLGWASATEQNDTEWRRTSDTKLCNVLAWEEGDYIEQNLNQPTYEEDGRRIRSNYPNYIKQTAELWIKGPVVRGEGLYRCYNRGSCVSPDLCSCADGWTDADCKTALCRYEQRDIFVSRLQVVGCLNAGSCLRKDYCSCVKTDSILQTIHTAIERFPEFPPFVKETGFMGTDCSIPMCVQGYWDQTCRGVTPGGEGCYRCKNGGNCTAPDFCTCTPDWTGFDCSIPVCVAIADTETIYELQTVDVGRVQDFELDPCIEREERKLVNAPKLYDPRTNKGDKNFERLNWREGQDYMMSRGNCTRPMSCTCLCYEQNPEWDPWQDPLERGLSAGFILGTSGEATGAGDVDDVNCAYGFEGNKRVIPVEEDPARAGDEVFMTCHFTIKVPEWYEEYSITLIVFGTLFAIGASIGYYYYRQWLQRVWMRKKAEKRRSRKSSESSIGNIGGGGGRSSSRVVGSKRTKSSGKVTKSGRSSDVGGKKKKKKKKKKKDKKKKKSKSRV